jgi:AsmA protein
VTAVIAFKRLGFVIAGVVLGGLAVLGCMALLTSDDKVREAVKAELHSVTGLELTLRGNVAVSLFPTGSITFTNVALGDDTQPALTAARATARLRFFPLFVGRIEIADVTLVEPQIMVEFNPNGSSNWSTLVDRLARTPGPQPKRAELVAPFSEIALEGGTIILRDASRGIYETLRGVQLALAWPSISKTFAATGRVIWRGEPLDTTINLSDFAAALAGNRSGIKVRLQGVPIKFAFEGSMSVRPTLKIDGTVAADAVALRDTLHWAGLRPLTGGGFGRFSLKAKTAIAGGTIALSAVNVELDGNAAEGVITYATAGRQTLQGTLAAEELDLTPYISTIQLLTSNDRDWNRMPIVLDGLSGFDLDLRLSAARITLSRAKLNRTALAANLRGGSLTVTIGEAQAFGGIAKGSFVLAASEHGADLKSQMQFTDVDLESCLNELFNLRRIEGRGNISIAVEATGNNVLGLTRTMNGTAQLTGRQGAIVGLNVEQLLRRLERRPLSGTGDFRTGRTPFEKMTMNVKIAQGIATIENGLIEGPKVRLALGGQASIPGREFDLRGIAALIGSGAADAPPAFELPFVVQGPWDDPLMLPDTQALLQRSPAAAPLLRERSTRDTVQKAIDRLTRGSATTPAPAAAPPAQ